MQACPCTLNSTYTGGSQIQPGHKNPDCHSSLIGYQRLSSPPAQHDPQQHVQAASQHSTAPSEASAAVTASAVSVQPRASPTDEPQPRPSLAQDAEDAEAGSSSGNETEQDEEDAASCQDSVSELDPTGVPSGLVCLASGARYQVDFIQHISLPFICNSLMPSTNCSSQQSIALHGHCCIDASIPTSLCLITCCR